MKNRSWILGAVAVLLLLAGCTVSISTPFPPPDADVETISAGVSESASASGQFFFTSGETRWFEVDLTQTAQNQEAFFFELSTESSVQLTLFSAGGSALGSTTQATAFFAGATGLSSAASTPGDVSPAAVTAADICVGACVIRDASSGTFYARVTNTGSARNITLYAYARNYYDSEETANDEESSAVTLALGPNSGAIERIGDVDYWEVPSDGEVTFNEYSGAPAIQRRVLVIFDSGTEGPYTPADSPINVFAGDLVAVYEAGNDAAGPAGFSGYTLTYTPD